jgi:hypothetical protein
MNRIPSRNNRRPTGHTLIELIAAMVASSFLLAGLASVMMIGRQVAYTPSAAMNRTESANIANQIAEELRYATLIIQQTQQILEFVIADRETDDAAEKIRYEWSGVAGAPLYKTINSGTPVVVLDSVNAFAISVLQTSSTTTLTTTTDSAETLLASNATSPNGSERVLNTSRFSAQQIIPTTFNSVPANALYWNATKADFYGSKDSGDNETLLVQLRASGDYFDSPTSQVLVSRSLPETAMSGSSSWNSATFSTTLRELSLNRRYSLVLAGLNGDACRLIYNDSAASGVNESIDGGATWQYMTNRQIYYRLYGTYTTPGPSYNVTRNYVTNVGLTLQTSSQTHGRVDANIPLANRPELLAAHWRADFNSSPTATNANGDGALDWAMASGTFNSATLIGGAWHASGAIETRPLSDFTTVTTVETRCRNTSVGGNGAVIRINADRQGGQYAPVLVYVQRQPDGTQTATLISRTTDAATRQLCSRTKLSSGFVRIKLTILPQNNVVHWQINDEDQGTYSYSTYAPASASDRFLTLYADTSLAEFDYIDVRSATN